MLVRRLLSVLGLFACLVLVGGCQSGGAPAPSAGMSKAVLITPGNGGFVLIVPTSDGGTAKYMSSENMAVCKQCEADAEAYFKTGKIDPVCSVCGAKRTVIVPTVTSGHN